MTGTGASPSGSGVAGAGPDPAPGTRPTSGAGSPAEALAGYVRQHPRVSRWCVAYSGGRDSHVLLHAAAALFGARGGAPVALRALHVDHGLAPDSAAWAEHCGDVARELGVPLEVRCVDVVEAGEGPEAAARAARYAAFAAHLAEDEHLLVAQHARDQAETFLMQALRGSGPDGLASMPRRRNFARGVMARPLIACTPEAIGAHAAAHGLRWLEDPSNVDTRLDRNYLRLEVLPLLEVRWPAAVHTLSRAAHRCGAASQTLLGVAGEDLERVRLRGSDELSVSELRALPRERAYNALRLRVRHAGLRMPRLQDLARVIDELVHARPDAAGIVDVRDYEFRRHADRLYVLPPHVEAEAFELDWRAPFDDVAVPGTDIVLSRQACTARGIRLPAAGSVGVRSRLGGELIKLGEPAFHKAVKKLLQESAVPPWRRDRIPLLYVDGRLAAVWGVAVATDFRLPATARPPYVAGADAADDAPG